MRALFDEVGTLDKRCYDVLALSEDILMENAARSLCDCVKAVYNENDRVLILCGPGNNGADGIACARMLVGFCDVAILLPHGVKSKMAKVQLKRAEAVGVEIIEELAPADIYVDALFGSGLARELDTLTEDIVHWVNAVDGKKIACDIPSGIDLKGVVKSVAFKADTTLTMGALKTALYTDRAKDYVGHIIVSDLGVHHSVYEEESHTWLLETSDLALPLRNSSDVNKGSFGHLAVVCGEKKGASILAALAGSAFGAGLVSIIGEDKNIPLHLMQSTHLPENCTAVVAGMGLGDEAEEAQLYELLLNHIHPVVIDADLCYTPLITELLIAEKPVVFTPHPKEFSALLNIGGLGSYSVEEIQHNRFTLAQEFTARFDKILVLKGANTIIAYKEELYVCDLGTPALAKGGSGDVLAGMIGALLAQGKHPKDAAIQAVLAHALSAKRFEKHTYALQPQDIIEGIKCL